MTPIEWKVFERMVEIGKRNPEARQLMDLISSLSIAVDERGCSEALDSRESDLYLATVAASEYLTAVSPDPLICEQELVTNRWQ